MDPWIYRSMDLWIYRSIYLYLSIDLSIYLSIDQYIDPIDDVSGHSSIRVFRSGTLGPRLPSDHEQKWERPGGCSVKNP